MEKNIFIRMNDVNIINEKVNDKAFNEFYDLFHLLSDDILYDNILDWSITDNEVNIDTLQDYGWFDTFQNMLYRAKEKQII